MLPTVSTRRQKVHIIIGRWTVCVMGICINMCEYLKHDDDDGYLALVYLMLPVCLELFFYFFLFYIEEIKEEGESKEH